MSQITGETHASKVLLDVTPPDAVATFINEEKQKPAVPFVDMVKTRIEGYVGLKRKYYDQLDEDTMLQTAVGPSWMLSMLDLGQR